MKPPSIRPVRCAIYTRVSTEHGLDQEFNSLDAQYDAASAYIRSQAHAGWTLIRSRYDDGGYSGGSTDRPDLQRLLDDIRARKIDVIVVYKVDRLTRSLADFIVSISCLIFNREYLTTHPAASDRPDDRLLTIPWHKPPSKRSRQILLPHNASRSDVRPEQFERRARLVSAIARGRRWLDDVVSGRLQGRPSDQVIGGLRQTGRTVRCPRRLVCLGHPAVQYHDLHGPVDSQCAPVHRDMTTADIPVGPPIVPTC